MYSLRMLIELRIENLLLIERAELAFDSGFNAITGETGAGKTMLAHAIDLLLGGKSRKGIVREGAQEAYVEGLFTLPAGLIERPEFAEIRERLPDPMAAEIALARRVTPEGRTRAYIEGRSATAADLRELGGALVSFYGQHEHRKLTLSGVQLAALDGFAGQKHVALVSEAGRLHAEVRRLQQVLSELELVDGRRERELGLIEFELAEIDELQPDELDHAALCAERDRLKAIDILRAAADSALTAIDDDESGGAGALVAAAAASLAGAVGSDATLDALGSRVEALSIELRDAAAELRAYGEGLAADPQRLAEVEERLDGYERLMRKHGGSVAAVIQHADACRIDRDRLSGSAEQIADARSQLIQLSDEQLAVAKRISKSRHSVAPKLAVAVRDRLAQLALADASFEIEIATDPADLRGGGCDRVEFLIAPNPGVAAAPLRETASGGELSRVMLALLTASGAGGDQTFVFDEIDAGIGGHTARAVGEELRALGAGRQVICITHLPQVAAAATRHFQIDKQTVGGTTVTEVRRLGEDAVVDELCRMLGAADGDAGARRHARELLSAA